MAYRRSLKSCATCGRRVYLTRGSRCPRCAREDRQRALCETLERRTEERILADPEIMARLDAAKKGVIL